MCKGNCRVAKSLKGPLVQRGLAPRSGDWGIVSTIILQDHSNGNMFIQSLRHGCAAPPPFTQGRLLIGGGKRCSISLCIRGDFGLCCVEVPLYGKTKKVPLLCGSGLFSVSVNIQNTWKCLLRCSYSRIRADRLCSKYLYNAHQRHCTEIPYSLP